MKGQPIDDAMAAAREFAARRRPEQELGVVFFAKEARVALAPTTDEARIDNVLSEIPELSRGTQIFDASKVAIDLLASSKAAAPSLLVLSDGADTASALTGGDVTSLAHDAGVRIYAVGLRSRDYDADGLRSVTSEDRYLEAADSRELSRTFAGLGQRFGNEYVVRYTSIAPLDSQVAVGIEVDGVSGIAAAAYQTPSLNLPSAGTSSPEASVWQSRVLGFVVALAFALLVALALFLVTRPRRKSVGERVSSFVFVRQRDELEFEREDSDGLLHAIEHGLRDRKFWQAFKLDVEIAGLRPTAIQLAAGTVVGSLLIAMLAVLLDRPAIAVVALIVTPIVVRIGVRVAADKVRRKFGDQLPDNLQVLASALRAGHSFSGALKTMTNDAPEPSKTEYRRVVTDEQLGISIENSLNLVSERMKNEEVAYIGLIATLQRETGGNTAEVLDRVTQTIRERMKLKRLVSTLTAQGRFGGWIVTALPVAMVVILSIVKPDYMDPMLANIGGIIALVAAALMVVTGAFVIRKIVDIDV
jgi:tight adherence protein B